MKWRWLGRAFSDLLEEAWAHALITPSKSQDFFLGNSLSWNIEEIFNLPAPMEIFEAGE